MQLARRCGRQPRRRRAREARQRHLRVRGRSVRASNQECDHRKHTTRVHHAGRPREVALRGRGTPSRGRVRARGRRGQRLADGRAVRGSRALVRARVRQDRPRVGGPAVILRDGGLVRPRRKKREPSSVRVRRGARLGAVRRARPASVRPVDRRRRGPKRNPRAQRSGRGAETRVVVRRTRRPGDAPANGLAAPAGRAAAATREAAGLPPGNLGMSGASAAAMLAMLRGMAGPEKTAKQPAAVVDAGADDSDSIPR